MRQELQRLEKAWTRLECTVRASSSAHPAQPPTPGTLARSHHKLLADFSHILTCRFINSNKCNQRRTPSSVDLFSPPYPCPGSVSAACAGVRGRLRGGGVRDTQLGRRGHRGCANEGPGSWEALGLYRPTL
ncbi:hypothetical protein CRENBAI_017178 [Crenichthys baileyi]|uniref:Uncharacterized protein n=1 Tax=Crenichthys baileyi TaxID=28760 RepID=A0AAV9RQU5_9TELE